MVPATVGIIVRRAFYGSYRLAKVEFAGESAWEEIGCESFVGTSLTEILIPAKCRIIAVHAFRRVSTLAMIDLQTTAHWK